MKKIILLTALILLTSTFSQAKGYKILANLSGFENGTKFYLEDIELQEIIDSTVIENNNFIFKGNFAEIPKQLVLGTDNEVKDYVYCFLLIGNENIEIKGDKKDFPDNLSITGSKIQEINNLIKNTNKERNNRRNDLGKQLMSFKGDSTETAIYSKNIWKEVNKIDSLNDIETKKFIDNNINSFAALKHLTYMKEKYNRDILQILSNKLTNEFKDCRYAKNIETYLKIGKVIEEGDNFYDFEASDFEGKKHKISDTKGKFILLDFYFNGCGPCIQSVSDMKKLHESFPDNFEIISFNTDKNKSEWQKSIKRDKPEWKNINDGKGRNGEVEMKYGVTGYPTFFLINPEGKIIKKFVGFGISKSGVGTLEPAVSKVLNIKQ